MISPGDSDVLQTQARNENLPCPCGSGSLFEYCCGPLISGRNAAKTPLELMRSRYTAYVLSEAGYLLETWAPASRPKDFQFHGPLPQWLSLKIHGSTGGQQDEEEGYVDFSASYFQDGCCWTLRENSRFVRMAGKWYYHRGDARTTQTKVHRNSLCPCGSGRKFKRCCSR